MTRATEQPVEHLPDGRMTAYGLEVWPTGKVGPNPRRIIIDRSTALLIAAAVLTSEREARSVCVYSAPK